MAACTLGAVLREEENALTVFVFAYMCVTIFKRAVSDSIRKVCCPVVGLSIAGGGVSALPFSQLSRTMAKCLDVNPPAPLSSSI